MDRVHPKNTQVIVPIEAFALEQIVVNIKETSAKDTDEDATVLELDSLESDPKSLVEDEPPPPPRKPALNIPKIVITRETELSPTESEGQPFPQFEELMNASRFIMSYTSHSSSKVFTPNGIVLFKCNYPSSSYWEGCHPDAMEKIVEILEFRTSKLIMQLRHQTLPCHSCFEEETNSIDLIGPDERLLATIIQKKTWVNTKINRDIIIRPGPFGKSDTYKAQFTWNDASINFKPHRSGIIVATLMTDCQEAPNTSDYVLQFLRDIRPRDKAMLIGVMIARDVLMVDETQTRDVVERATLCIVVIGFILLFLYVFLPSRD